MRSFMVWDGRGDDLLRAWLEADATLIAATRNALPYLLDLYDAAKALHAALDQMETFARVGSPAESVAGARLLIHKAEARHRAALAALDARMAGTT
jgi:hypothetical protein